MKKEKINEKIEIFKLGGAFFDPITIKNFFNFLSRYYFHKRLYVVSAVAGVTRLLDTIYFVQKQKNIETSYKEQVKELALKEFLKVHQSLIDELFTDTQLKKIIEVDFFQLHQWLRSVTSTEVIDEKYHAQILKFGELASSQILSRYLKYIHMDNLLLNAGDYLISEVHNGDFCHAEVSYVKPLDNLFNYSKTLITQGFISKNKLGEDTVLSYDGSDTSAAELASELRKSSSVDLIFWKDVCGIYTADPKHIAHKSYKAQMSYDVALNQLEETGTFPVAKQALIVLKEAGIASKVRSYLNFNEDGTDLY